MRIGLWLAAAAGLALIAGSVAPVEAAGRARTGVKAKAAAKKRVVAPRAVAARPVATVAPAPLPPAPASDATLAAYRYVDDADGLMGAMGDTAPHLAFDWAGAGGRGDGYAWVLGDGSTVIMEPMAAGDARFYFFEPDMTAPFLVRDRLYAFGFERGRWAALYDGDGRLAPLDPGSWQAGLAAELLARGRQLWFAARTPAGAGRPVDRRREGLEARSISITLLGDFGRWRNDDGRRRYRRGPGFDRWQTRDAHYRREHDERARRPGGRWNDGADARPRPPQPPAPTPPIARGGSTGPSRNGWWGSRGGGSTPVADAPARGGWAGRPGDAPRAGEGPRADAGPGRGNGRGGGGRPDPAAPVAVAEPAPVTPVAEAPPRARPGGGARPERGETAPVPRPVTASAPPAPMPVAAPDPAAPAPVAVAPPPAPEPAPRAPDPAPPPRADPPPAPPREPTLAEQKQAARAAEMGNEDAPQ